MRLMKKWEENDSIAGFETTHREPCEGSRV